MHGSCPLRLSPEKSSSDKLLRTGFMKEPQKCLCAALKIQSIFT